MKSFWHFRFYVTKPDENDRQLPRLIICPDLIKRKKDIYLSYNIEIINDTLQFVYMYRQGP